MFDIHSHILPDIDDGAANIEESLQLLEEMKQQGITDVMATPHFYPHEDSLTDFIENSEQAYKELLRAAEGRNLPRIHLGCEILYFEGMGRSQSLGELCLADSPYLLVELTDECIGESLFTNMEYLVDNSDIIPIIAHVERYYRSKNYRKFIKLLKKENVTVQINASSVLDKTYEKVIKKLLKSGLNLIIGTDAHSVGERPPQMDKAIKFIAQKYGKSTIDKILRNMNRIHHSIIADGEN